MSQASKSQALMWILFAYLCCITAAGAYLYLADGHGLLDSFIADVIATAVIFGFSRAFRNSSFYDAYWSVIPPLFLMYWWFTRATDTQVLRYVLVSIVVWYWACRLTWNWAKHWEGLAHEDWRYPIVKQKLPGCDMIPDFLGIHLFPSIQVFLGMLPMYAAVALSTKAVGWLDYVAWAIGIVAVSIQLIADRQLHRFIATRKPGQIIDSGLWGWSRHPNYFGEISFWFSLALFGLAAYPEGWWWQIIGVISMLTMFLLASIPLMEKRSLECRPQYQDIIHRVSMLVPLPPRKK
jgi:steroid 5-alpha reductase family enzyme